MKLPLGESKGMYDGMDIEELLEVASSRDPRASTDMASVEAQASKALPLDVIEKMKSLVARFPRGMMAARLGDEWKAKHGQGCPWAELGFERQGGFLKAMEGKAVKLWRKRDGDDYKVCPINPKTLNPQRSPSTLNPQPSTLNPQPKTQNPKPKTLNPQP